MGKIKSNRIGMCTARRLPYIPPKYERKEMTLEAKREFYCLPIYEQLYYRQFNPALGEPETKKPDDDDDDEVEKAWFSKPACPLVPSAERMAPPRGFKSAADELRDWEAYLAKQTEETRTYIQSILATKGGGGGFGGFGGPFGKRIVISDLEG